MYLFVSKLKLMPHLAKNKMQVVEKSRDVSYTLFPLNMSDMFPLNMSQLVNNAYLIIVYFKQ